MPWLVSVSGSTAPSSATRATKRSEPDGALVTYLEAHKAPGRTHHTLTRRGRDALADRVRTPAALTGATPRPTP